MEPPLDTCHLHFMHQDQVIEAPPDAVVLGRADHCEVAMFRVGDTMLGVQAHPEFTRGLRRGAADRPHRAHRR